METQKRREDVEKGGKHAADPDRDRKDREKDPNRQGGQPDRDREDVKGGREGDRSPNR